ncbi:unnamed protein product [Protopolystoma xenopodis]|uniref:Uncharacterized protein n=1 Tax=Protopolystoma xenopodis TaxID=117903 RepID=A0A448XLG5_9PLAT|nr:unnamed protein product [Protopolystoma xenopodis]
MSFTVQTKALHSFIEVVGRGAKDFFAQLNRLPYAAIILRFPLSLYKRSDDVHHMMDGSSVCFQMKRKRKSRGLRQPERRTEAKQLQYDGNHSSSSDEIEFRISSSCPNKDIPNIISCEGNICSLACHT